MSVATTASCEPRVATMHLLVDGRQIDGRATGLSRLSEELVHALAALPGLRLTVASSRPITPRVAFPRHVDVVVERSVLKRLPGSLWLGLRVPGLATRLGVTHVLGVLQVLPWFKPRHLRYGVYMHDLVYLLFPETMVASNRWLSRLLVPRSLRVADVIFGLSQTTLADLRRHYPGLRTRAVVAYPGATFAPGEASLPAGGDPPRPLRLLSVGSHEPRKNLLTFLRAFELARAQGFTGELHLVSGARWGQDALEGIVARLEGRGITSHRSVSDAALMGLYQQADFLVMPSLYEGLGLPILEAVGRCAVVANDIPVFRELEQHVQGITFMRFEAEASAVERLAQQFAQLTPQPPARFRNEAAQRLFTWQAGARTIRAALAATGGTPEPGGMPPPC